VLVLHSLDRLSRDTLDTLDTLTTIRDLTAKGVRVRVLNMDLNASTPIGRFALTIFAAFSQLAPIPFS
jgi:DNA invertase Pin-like site-specific DNA recombinase